MNKRLLRCFFCFLLVFASTTLWAETKIGYLGLDFLMNNSSFEHDQGSRLFYNRATPQFNLFIGRFFNNWLGIEFGHEYMTSQEKSSVIRANETILDVPNFSNGNLNTYKSDKKLKAFNLSVAPKVTLTPEISFSPLIGVGYFTANYILTIQNVNQVPATELEKSNLNIQFYAKKILPRLGVRLYYDVHENIGIRASFIWENTKRLNPSGQRNLDPSQTLTTKMKNSFSLGLGLFYQI